VSGKTALMVIFFLLICLGAGLYLFAPFDQENQPLSVVRSFELVYHTQDSSFDGRSNFREPEGTPEMSTEQRIEYLRLLASRLSGEAGELLDSPVVTERMIEEARAKLRPAPLPQMRTLQPLSYWRWQIDADGEAADAWSTAEFDDQNWNEIEVPYVREVPADLWFRTRVRIDAPALVFLQLEQPIDECWIWVNGRLVKHQDGYQPLTAEISGFLEPGAENLIAVRFAAKPGDQVGFCGYVRMVLTNEQFIDEPFVFTDKLGPRRGGVAEAEQVVRCLVRNQSRSPFEGNLEADFTPWAGAAGKALPVKGSIPVAVPAGGESSLELRLSVPAAELWSPDRPVLYKVRLLLTAGDGREVDDAVVISGVRKIEQDGNRFRLNGEPFFMVGFLDTLTSPPRSLTGTHGDIVPSDQNIIRTILAAKGANANTIRIHSLGMTSPDKYLANGWPPFTVMSDYTNYSRYAEIADQLGIALSWTTRFGGFQMSFLKRNPEKALIEQLPGSIKSVRNHPSIFVYEGMNEVALVLGRGLEAAKSPSPQLKANVERYRKVRGDYIRTVNRVDPTRLINPDSSWINDHRMEPWIPDEALDAGNVYANLHLYYGWYRPTASIWALPAFCNPAGRSKAFVLHEMGSEAMPNWSLYSEYDWNGIWINNASRYCRDLERTAIGRPFRVLENSEYQLSQAYQGLLFQLYATAVRNYGGDGFTICTLADGFGRSLYHKGALDLYYRAKLGWVMARIVMGEYYPSGADGDVVLTPGDPLRIKVSSISPQKAGASRLIVSVKDAVGKEVDRRVFSVPDLRYGVTEVGEWFPGFPEEGFYFIDYELRQ
jgi:hypothetical protein